MIMHVYHSGGVGGYEVRGSEVQVQQNIGLGQA